MDDNSNEVIPQENRIEPAEQSDLCIGYDSVILPPNTVTSSTIEVTQYVTHPTLRKAQLVTSNLKMRQGIAI